MIRLLRQMLGIGLFIAGFAVAVSAAPATMRVDYYHTGDATKEFFSLDRISIEPLPWPGNPNRPIDNTNLGKYFFEVKDKQSGRVLYSRGFASIYGEWETTDEANRMMRSFHESFRFPEPTAPVQVVLHKRDAKNGWQQIWSLEVDPKNMFVDRARVPAPAPLLTIQKMGEPGTKIDFLILGDGYTAAETKKFEADAKRLTEALFATSPFKERRRDFNVWALCPPSLESGISRPSTGVYRDSLYGTMYDAFGSERYILAFDNRGLRRVAQFAPYEFIEILANNRTYGGGGIFNLYGTVAADNAWANYVFIHEFGHHFAALADEYYTSPVAYAPAPATGRVEPWEPNVTALAGLSAPVTGGSDWVRKNLKWADLIAPDTPIPTPWNKEAYEEYSRAVQKRRAQLRQEKRPESEMEALFSEQLKREDALFASEKYRGKVGAFEGANYEAKGYYRPEANCIMFTRTDYFCTVCRRGINTVIDLYTK